MAEYTKSPTEPDDQGLYGTDMDRVVATRVEEVEAIARKNARVEPTPKSENTRDLAQRLGISSEDAKRLEAKGDLLNVIFDTVVPALENGADPNKIREGYIQALATDNIHPGSGDYVLLMNVFQQFMLKVVDRKGQPDQDFINKVKAAWSARKKKTAAV